MWCITKNSVPSTCFTVKLNVVCSRALARGLMQHFVVIFTENGAIYYCTCSLLCPVIVFRKEFVTPYTKCFQERKNFTDWTRLSALHLYWGGFLGPVGHRQMMNPSVMNLEHHPSWIFCGFLTRSKADTMEKAYFGSASRQLQALSMQSCRSSARNLHSSGYTQTICSQGGGPCEGFETRWKDDHE